MILFVVNIIFDFVNLNKKENPANGWGYCNNDVIQLMLLRKSTDQGIKVRNAHAARQNMEQWKLLLSNNLISGFILLIAMV